MLRILATGSFLIFVIVGCGRKYSENELQEMQRKSDSVNRHKTLEEKLRSYDSLAVKVDSVKVK